MTGLGLGTVQFGMPYGVANQGAITAARDVAGILSLATRSGMRIVDTAALYGNSEAVLGAALPQEHSFRIVTKTQKFGHAVGAARNANNLIRTFERSLENLRQERLYALLLHDVDDLLAPGGDALWKALDGLQREGRLERIGASVYTATQIDSLLAHFDPTLVQAPVSIVDQRLVQSGHLSKLKRRNVEIHARSVLLQGLLLMAPADRKPYFGQFANELSNFNRLLSQHGMTPLEGALSFVRDLEDVDAALVGVTSLTQLQACLDAFSRPHADSLDFSVAACRSESLLNPALWPSST